MGDTIEPVFNNIPETPQKILETPQKQVQPPKLTKLTKLGGPSIKDALSGNFNEPELLLAKEQYLEYNYFDKLEPFSADDLKAKWELFLTRLTERPSIKSSLSNLPQITDDYTLVLEINNRIQEDLINTIKPELTSWLRAELKNSKIQIITKITETVKERVIYTDSEKFDEMIKRNPHLTVLKQKFNLSFGH
ncbi:MAG: hypothetical protein LBV47_05470 [Bacteroidales bacterium]|nr:hypothetical protein [Bacteroidales bacterium]